MRQARKMSFREALNECLREEMTRDESVFLIGEEIGPSGGAFKVTEGLLSTFGKDRILETPISESAIVGMAIGATLNGMRPIVEIMYSDFLSLCADHIVNGAAKVSYQYGGQACCPVVIRAPTGITGAGAGMHHSQSCESMLLNFPGLKVVVPSSPYDAKGLLKSAIRDNDPVIFLEHKMLYNTVGNVPEEDYTIPLGSADVKREGDDVTIVCTGYMVPLSIEVAEKLQRDGISCEILDLRTLLPLDENKVIESVRKTNRLIIVQEAPKKYGYGAEIAATIAEKAIEFLDSPIRRIANPGTPIPYTTFLEKAVIPAEKDIVETVKELVP
jgi:pyruvate dehydrogenase E1 component beta subunit